MKRKTLAAVFGFLAGMAIAPLALVVLPLFFAWFFANEMEEYE